MFEKRKLYHYEVKHTSDKYKGLKKLEHVVNTGSPKTSVPQKEKIKNVFHKNLLLGHESNCLW